MQLWAISQSLLLLALANGTPVLAKKIFGARLALPLDAGACFLDGQPLLGASKTVRGLVASIGVTAVAAPLVGLSIFAGALVAALAMIGDLLSSFVKRRLRLPPSAQAMFLDQIPESLLPLWVCRNILSLTVADIAACASIFLIGELVVSRLLYAWHIRDQPY